MIRQYRSTDREALYRVCLLTGDSGFDATSRYRDGSLVGHVFVGPYVELHPELAFVVDDGAGAEGYVLGVTDSAIFAQECEQRWWPPLRSQYDGVNATDGYGDQWLLNWIRTPPAVPDFASAYPSHLHIDLLPRWQSGGWGRRLIDAVLAEFQTTGSRGVHLGVGRANERAVGFYRHLGFEDLEGDDNTLWLGKRLDR